MRKTLVLSAGLLLLASCSRDTTRPAAEALSPAEVHALTAQLARHSGSGLLLLFGSERGPRAAAAPVEVQATISAPCPLGGSLRVETRVTGTVDDARRDVALTGTVTLTHTACAVTAEKTTLTLTGAPNLVARSSTHVVDGRPAGLQSASLQGGFAWRTADGRSGTCQVNTSSTLDVAARLLTVTGSVCGTQVDVKTSWT